VNKHQIPSTKFQISSNYQFPKVSVIGIWLLKHYLEFGI
jgi:hypothetical protein